MTDERPAPSANQLTNDEGGLRPPDHLRGWRRWWWWFDFLILVKIARLRFIGILLVIGIVITQWDLIVAYYERWTRPAIGQAAASSDTEYFCPMHPSVVRDNGKEKCPICFMPLAKRKKGTAQTEALPAGVVNRVQLSPYRVVLAGVNTTEVMPIALTRSITTVGVIDFNERAQKIVSARVKGRIDKLYVNQTGQAVKAGESLASLYSPELIVTIDNLLQAQKSSNRQYARDAEERLRLLGIDDTQVRQLAQEEAPATDVQIRSPLTGHVIQKFVKEGQYVEEGMPLYEIADLSTVWIQAQIYEDDLGMLPLDNQGAMAKSGQASVRVTARTRSFPNELFEGRLTFVYPHLDEDSRTVTVRFELDNSEHKLRPGGTATVTLEIAPSQMPQFTATSLKHTSESQPDAGLLAVPESAVIDTGSQRLVYRESLPGVFEGITVELGPKMVNADGVTYYPVMHGLSEGEKIVTSGAFLIDAETRLNPAAGSIYFGGSSGSESTGSSLITVRPTTPEDPDAKIVASLAKLPQADRALAETQRFCPVLQTSRLGSMGVPIKLIVKGEPVFVCCEGCKAQAIQNAYGTIERVRASRSNSGNVAGLPPDGKHSKEAMIAAALAKLSDSDRQLAEAQRFCVVIDDSRLGSMGTPIKVLIKGELAFVCCEGCIESAKKDADKSLTKLRRLRGSKLPSGKRGTPDDQIKTSND